MTTDDLTTDIPTIDNEPASEATETADKPARGFAELGVRAELVEALDETLLGLRPRPQSVLRVA